MAKNQLNTPSDTFESAMRELLRQGRVEVVKDDKGREVYRLVKN